MDKKQSVENCTNSDLKLSIQRICSIYDEILLIYKNIQLIRFQYNIFSVLKWMNEFYSRLVFRF